jgi:hypothetical protein
MIYFNVKGQAEPKELKLPEDLKEKLLKLLDLNIINEKDIEDVVLFETEPQAVLLLYELVTIKWPTDRII